MMRSSRRLEFAPRARTDLRSLRSFSLATWGEAHAASYVRRLTSSMRGLVEHPHLGRDRGDLALGLRALTVAHHVIFYQVDEHTVTIVRVLHARMDPARHIGPPS